LSSRTTLAWLETALAALSACLFLVTLVWHEWIEAVFGVDPDHGDGSIEFVITLVLLGFAITASLVARTEWRAQRRARSSPRAEPL
jgi:uncharacterized membrane protein YidH (DUF202 family)